MVLSTAPMPILHTVHRWGGWVWWWWRVREECTTLWPLHLTSSTGKQQLLLLHNNAHHFNKIKNWQRNVAVIWIPGHVLLHCAPWQQDNYCMTGIQMSQNSHPQSVCTLRGCVMSLLCCLSHWHGVKMMIKNHGKTHNVCSPPNLLYSKSSLSHTHAIKNKYRNATILDAFHNSHRHMPLAETCLYKHYFMGTLALSWSTWTSLIPAWQVLV